jgi:hypothetical protein
MEVPDAGFSALAAWMADEVNERRAAQNMHVSGRRERPARAISKRREAMVGLMLWRDVGDRDGFWKFVGLRAHASSVRSLERPPIREHGAIGRCPGLGVERVA